VLRRLVSTCKGPCANGGAIGAHLNGFATLMAAAAGQLADEGLIFQHQKEESSWEL